MKKWTIKDMTVTAAMAAVLCVAAPFTIPTGLIPVTLASFTVYLAAAILGAKKGIISVALYILIGAVGLPVFSGFKSGLGVLAGPTGGYLIGYLFCAAAVGLAVDRWGKRFWVFPAAMIAGTVLLYAFGTAWFMVQSGNGLLYALGVCVVPFLIGDAVKIVAASGAAFQVRKALRKASLLNA